MLLTLYVFMCIFILLGFCIMIIPYRRAPKLANILFLFFRIAGGVLIVFLLIFYGVELLKVTSVEDKSTKTETVTCLEEDVIQTEEKIKDSILVSDESFNK